MVNYNQAYLESLVKPGSTKLSILVDNCQKPGKSGSTRVSDQAHQAFNQTFGARVSILPKLRANWHNIVSQQLSTLLDVTCWVRLHTLLHFVGCCCVLLCKV